MKERTRQNIGIAGLLIGLAIVFFAAFFYGDEDLATVHIPQIAVMLTSAPFFAVAAWGTRSGI